MSNLPQFADNIKIQSPHVFILGAGASYAAFPNGDKYGRHLPLMNNIVDLLQLEPVLNKHGFHYDGENFEELYSRISSSKRTKPLVMEIEKRIYDYFAKMELPDHPTLYDHLVLSLRKKDFIASFNWDPLLWQACARNHEHVNLPHILFLHGNVAVGHCLKHRQAGPVTSLCPVCRKHLFPSKLLYPVVEKNYSRHPFIHAEWQALKAALRSAYALTIFGYGAPISDLEAITLMKQAWGSPTKRHLEEIEIIDIKTEKEVIKTWETFIHTHHYQVTQSFYESSAARYPRRSCEALWAKFVENKWMDSPCEQIPYHSNFIAWLSPLIEKEKIRI